MPGLDASARWKLSPEAGAEVAQQLRERASDLTTTTLTQIAEQHKWFTELDAESRSWITLIVRTGIDGFIVWLAEGPDAVSTLSMFDAAPRRLARTVLLHQTVELVRTSIATVESRIDQLVSKEYRSAAHFAILEYAREVAFSAAAVYAQAAEIRGAWDARIETLVVDAVVRGEADDAMKSRASTLGWREPTAITVAIGGIPSKDQNEELRRTAQQAGYDILVASQGDRLVIVMGGPFHNDAQAVSAVGSLAELFGPGPIVVGPAVSTFADASRSARAAMSGLRAASAWPSAPRPVSAMDLLPERVLAGDGHARRELAANVYQPLKQSSGSLLATLDVFFETGSSVEATARSMFVHANTVRYRLRRISEISGYSVHTSRDQYVLRLALTLGRLLY